MWDNLQGKHNEIREGDGFEEICFPANSDGIILLGTRDTYQNTDDLPP